jgi:hypothetical protein
MYELIHPTMWSVKVLRYLSTSSIHFTILPGVVERGKCGVDKMSRDENF